MLGNKNSLALVAVAIAICFVIGLSAVDSFAQKGGKGRYRKVTLKKDARKDGYKKITIQNVSYLQAINAQNPETGKPVEGRQKLEIKCTENDPVTILDAEFRLGSTEAFRNPCDDFVFVMDLILSY